MQSKAKSIILIERVRLIIYLKFGIVFCGVGTCFDPVKGDSGILYSLSKVYLSHNIHVITLRLAQSCEYRNFVNCVW